MKVENDDDVIKEGYCLISRYFPVMRLPLPILYDKDMNEYKLSTKTESDDMRNFKARLLNVNRNDGMSSRGIPFINKDRQSYRYQNKTKKTKKTKKTMREENDINNVAAEESPELGMRSNTDESENDEENDELLDLNLCVRYFQSMNYLLLQRSIEELIFYYKLVKENNKVTKFQRISFQLGQRLPLDDIGLTEDLCMKYDGMINAFRRKYGDVEWRGNKLVLLRKGVCRGGNDNNDGNTNIAKKTKNKRNKLTANKKKMVRNARSLKSNNKNINNEEESEWSEEESEHLGRGDYESTSSDEQEKELKDKRKDNKSIMHHKKKIKIKANRKKCNDNIDKTEEIEK